MKILEGTYEAKLEFQGAKQKPSRRGVWIFSGTAQFFSKMTIKRKASSFLMDLGRHLTSHIDVTTSSPLQPKKLSLSMSA